MASHYCGEHEKAFRKFEKGGQTWYSHKIDGTEEWCREKYDNEVSPPEEVPEQVEKPVKTYGESDTKTRSMAIAYAKDLAVAKLIGIEDMKRWANYFEVYIRGEDEKVSTVHGEAGTKDEAPEKFPTELTDMIIDVMTKLNWKELAMKTYVGSKYEIKGDELLAQGTIRQVLDSLDESQKQLMLVGLKTKMREGG